MQITPAIKELKSYMKNHNLNQLQLSFKSNIPQAKLSEIINAKRRFSVEADIKLCKLFSLAPAHFLSIQQKYEIEVTKQKIKDDLSKIIPL